MMESPQLQSTEIDSSTSSTPTGVTSIPMAALSPPGDDNQSLNNPQKAELQQNPPIQNPSSPPADSDPVQTAQPQALESKDPDPPNPDPENADQDLQQPVPDDQEDQEGMILSPSHQKLIPDPNIDEGRDILPPLSSSRRGPFRRKRGFSKSTHPKKLAALEKKFQALAKNLKPMPFVPNKVLDFSKHEENLRRLGLWDFAHLDFDRKVRNDLLAKLIVNYNEKNRCSYVDDVRIMVNQADLARALNLPSKKPVDCGEDWPKDFVLFVDDFVSNWMLLHEDTWMLPSEVMNWTVMIKEGHPEKVDWAKLIWFMVKRELAKGAQLENCYYASHLQHLMKFQKEGLLKEKSPDEVEEITVLKDDEEDECDVKMVECDDVSHGEEIDMNVENIQPSVDPIGNVRDDVNMVENVDNSGFMGNVSDAQNVGNIVHGDSTTVLGESQETAGDQVENPKTTVDQVESPQVTVDQAEYSKATGDHVDSLNTAVDHVGSPETETTVNLLENLETAVGHHVGNLETIDDHAGNLNTAADHVGDLETTGDHVENLEAVGDHVENLNMHSDHVEYMQTAGASVENKNIVEDTVEDMKIDVDHVEDIKTENADDVEIHQETGCNDLIDFEDCRVDGQDAWDLSRKDGEPEHFLRQCTMSEAKVNEEQTRQESGHQAEEIEDDEHEDDEHVQGFDILQKCNSFNSLSSGHLMQAMDSSQNPYSAPDFDNHMILGGPSSLFGNSSKRELDLDPEIPGHSLNDGHNKRMRTEGPSWDDQKQPDLGFCFEQMQQWMEKSRMACMSSHQALVNQQQLLFNELGSKDHIIQQLKLNNDELQRRRQAEIARYENELYAMSNVIDGYRKALKSTQQAFAEFRKRSSLPAEPLYKDAGEGGVVKSIVELEKERLKREEKERVARIIVEKFEKEWEMKFEGSVEQVGKFQARVSDIEKDVQLLKESVGKRKASEKLVEL